MHGYASVSLCVAVCPHTSLRLLLLLPPYILTWWLFSSLVLPPPHTHPSSQVQQQLSRNRDKDVDEILGKHEGKEAEKEKEGKEGKEGGVATVTEMDVVRAI